MSINKPKHEQSKYPATVTKLSKGGQAEAAGVVLGMHLHAINGEDCKGTSVKHVLKRIKARKPGEKLELFFVDEPKESFAARNAASGRNKVKRGLTKHQLTQHAIKGHAKKVNKKDCSIM